MEPVLSKNTMFFALQKTKNHGFVLCKNAFLQTTTILQKCDVFTAYNCKNVVLWFLLNILLVQKTKQLLNILLLQNVRQNTFLQKGHFCYNCGKARRIRVFVLRCKKEMLHCRAQQHVQLCTATMCFFATLTMSERTEEQNVRTTCFAEHLTCKNDIFARQIYALLRTAVPK